MMIPGHDGSTTPITLGRENPARRQGAAHALLIAILAAAGLTLTAVAVDGIALHLAQVEMRVATDAAALAAAYALVDDRTLIGGPAALSSVLQDARGEATAYALANAVAGPEPTDGDPIDVEFTTIEPESTSPARAWDEIPTVVPPPDLVRVMGYRTSARTRPVRLAATALVWPGIADMVQQSTAIVDRRVIGFRPSPDRPIPIVPLGILSDPTGREPASWEAQVAARALDDFSYDRAGGRFVESQGDGLSEVWLRIGVNTRVLAFGSRSDPARQVSTGLTVQDVAEQGGTLIVGPGGCLVDSWGDPARQDSVPVGLQAALGYLAHGAEPRIWPLFRRQAGDPRRVMLTGFVAARIVRVSTDSKGRMVVLIQPAALATLTAVVADEAGGEIGSGLGDAAVAPNLFVAKVRLLR
jgi:hypothetical protein